jgi:hypothetical protein
MKLFGKELNPIVIKVTLVLLFLSTLFPPFTFCNMYGNCTTVWSILFEPPEGKTIDLSILFIQYVLILFLMCIVHSFMKNKSKSE